jgi:hypothetical protein
MMFNVFLGNHPKGLYRIEDLIKPIISGIEACGHEVACGVSGLKPRPFVNVLVEFFDEAEVAERIIALKREQGDNFLFGVICTEDPDDHLVMTSTDYPRRRSNLLRVLAEADFVWPLLAAEEYRRFAKHPSRVALLKYGFDERLVSARRPANAPDIDVLIYGSMNERRQLIVDALTGRGLAVDVTFAAMPEYMRFDMVRRSRIVLDVRRGDSVRAPSPSRIVAALHQGAAVVSERFPNSILTYLAPYTIECDLPDVADRCQDLVRSGAYRNLALENLRRFREETSMAANMAEVLKLSFQ